MRCLFLVSQCRFRITLVPGGRLHTCFENGTPPPSATRCRGQRGCAMPVSCQQMLVLCHPWRTKPTPAAIKSTLRSRTLRVGHLARRSRGEERDARTMDTKIVAREDQIPKVCVLSVQDKPARRLDAGFPGTGGRMVKAFDEHPLCSPQLRNARLLRSGLGIQTRRYSVSPKRGCCIHRAGRLDC